jgi:ArsR family transcriptional regulator
MIDISFAMASLSSVANVSKAAQYFRALSDQTRLQIIERLREGEQCVCDLTDTFKTGQSRLSFHLRVLKDAGLVKDRPEGRWVYYSLNDEAVEDLQGILDWLKSRSHRLSKKNCCP